MERKRFSVLFFIKRSKLLKNGEAPVRVRVTYDRLYVELQLKRSVKVPLWSQEKEKSTGKDRNSVELNHYIDALRVKFYQIYQNLELEGKIVWRNKVQIQAGITVQRSLYDEPEEWSADKEHLTDAERYSDKILRTPNLYGYFTASYTPVKPFTIAFNGNYTGRMYVPHLMSEVNGTADVLVKSPDFFELGVKLSYDFRLTAAMTLQLNLGIQNLFDSYQNDFDKGATRDSGYIYGPGTPRTYYAGAKFSF